MQLFYSPDITNDVHLLNEEESMHCIRVLRHKKGDILFLVDGKGGFYKATILDDHPKKCIVTILETKKAYNKSPYHIHIAIAPPKHIDRFEWFLEKATEIGIDEITPLECFHSERSIIKKDRLNKVLVAAMKQSLKAYLPQLNDLIPFSKFIKQPHPGQAFIAHCHDQVKLSLKEVYQRSENTLILIGPEGDFSEAEIKLASAEKFQYISLSKSRLRTETAALVACHTIHLLND